ncbi:AraC-like transcriptional regulator QhpR [Chromohalobacter nigrandesensis]|uniref:AraC-like transcriptional regulator QhpR n=1 Tax=Chromohalobacter nigrandesensis TaxID=119863 RepID=UPI001FF19128|nr:AraC family transcriptional regulator [Chromohalobacter nigrandesensis]MCK0744202.1 AraC family transcriptional regulator [Chromohalobacter nigrandesensis]
MDLSLLQDQGATGVGEGNLGVLSAAASGLCDFIGHYGGDADRVLGSSGIDPERLAKPTLSLNLGNYCEVMENAARDSRCDNFGLYYGQQFRPQALGLIGYIGLCSATLGQALHNWVAAFPYHQHDTLIRLVENDDCWRLDYQVRHGRILCRRQDAELTMGMALNLIRHGAGSQWSPRAVLFEHPRPEQWHDHCKAFDAQVYFDQPVNSMLIPKRDLDRPMPDSDPLLLTVIQDAIRRLDGQRVLQSLIERTRDQVRQTLSLGEPTLETIAYRLDLSSWSLQRRLHRDGLSFSQIVDGIRQEMAAHYLRQPHLSISEMALLLGFSEVSAFSRAFRRWHGVSPRQWRHQQSN